MTPRDTTLQLAHTCPVHATNSRRYLGASTWAEQGRIGIQAAAGRCILPDRVPSGMSHVMVAVDSGESACGRAQWYLVLTSLSVYTCRRCSCLRAWFRQMALQHSLHDLWKPQKWLEEWRHMERVCP